MIKNKYITYLGVFIVLVLMSGCAGRAEVRPANVPDAAAVQAEQAIGGALVEAFVRNDAAAFVELLPEELRKQFGKPEFEQARNELRQTLGEPVSSRFETTLEHPLVGVSLWRVRFERRGAEGGSIHQEALFRVITGRPDGRAAVISFNFL